MVPGSVTGRYNAAGTGSTYTLRGSFCSGPGIEHIFAARNEGLLHIKNG